MLPLQLGPSRQLPGHAHRRCNSRTSSMSTFLIQPAHWSWQPAVDAIGNYNHLGSEGYPKNNALWDCSFVENPLSRSIHATSLGRLCTEWYDIQKRYRSRGHGRVLQTGRHWLATDHAKLATPMQTLWSWASRASKGPMAAMQAVVFWDIWRKS